ncbi:hypothetical protein [Amycolatopsis sp. BJA-103]|uniref:hypothetical protein n=1 Tax=Amycolatopsis sp. BJA-103 TaxID=1911175 RepID=UPI000C7720D1|nr:hypothetical protein [Amycolatopsis sp. BJA-103]AUI58419.1 hypothetical protein BKN51_09460 [Amycolatopsis sp. BJA-103]PNE15097.1 hypothetical protein B1H26_31440 [Amycolatopsis sp. BJA-103]
MLKELIKMAVVGERRVCEWRGRGTSNRITYLNGNKQFQRFAQVNTSIRATADNCSPVADPNYCLRFTTRVSTASP